MSLPGGSGQRPKWERPQRVQLAEHPQPHSEHRVALPNPSPSPGGPVPSNTSAPTRKRNDSVENREKGFSTYFSGANETVAKERSVAQRQQQALRRPTGGVKLSRKQLTEIRKSIETLPTSHDGPPRGVYDSMESDATAHQQEEECSEIVLRIAKLNDENRQRLLKVLRDMEAQDGAHRGDPTAVAWLDVEQQAGVAFSEEVPAQHHRYNTDGSDDAEDPVQGTTTVPSQASGGTPLGNDVPVWLETNTVVVVAPTTIPGTINPARPTSGRRAQSRHDTSVSPPLSSAPVQKAATPPLAGPLPDQGMLEQFHQERLGSSSAQEQRRAGVGAASPTPQTHSYVEGGIAQVTATGSGVPPVSPTMATPLPVVTAPFIVPLLPRGRVLLVNVLSTWGDPHYVGLTGFDIFDSTGRLVTLQSPADQVVGDPHSINVLPEYTNDPRTADKVMDGVNYTRDDVHMWLAPFTEGCSHVISITFDTPTSIAMIRVWNYNKSRVHSFRGARHVEMVLDGVPIFRGEVKMAPGVLEGCEGSTEILLFTTEPTILAKMELHYAKIERTASGPEDAVEVPRPKTSGGRNSGRPTTAVRSTPAPSIVPHRDQNATQRTGGPAPAFTEGDVVKVELLSTWGDTQNIGVQRIAILDSNGKTIGPVDETMVECNVRSPRDVSPLFGDGPLLPDYAFLAPLSEESVCFTVTFPQTVRVGGVRIWNYNRCLEDTFTGVKRLRLYVGNKCVSPPQGTYVRKAPGHTKFDHSHTVMMKDDAASLPLSVTRGDTIKGFNVAASINTQNVLLLRKAKLQMANGVPRALSETLGYEPVLFPVAYVFKFVLHSTQGDAHYVGLNGIELYDMEEALLPLEPRNLQAVPRDVTTLPSCATDVRVLDNLVDGCNSCATDENMWLAPYVTGKSNLLYVIFEHPTALSLIKVWNYGKTPSRGVKELSIFADDQLIFHGTLAPAAKGGTVQHQSLLFTSNPDTVAKELSNILSSGSSAMVLPTAPSPTPFSHELEE